MKRSGTTLLEMLIVIAVMVILMAFIYPSLASMFERGRSAKCAQHLRQLHIAALNYVTENNGVLPLGVSVDAQDPDSGLWAHYAGWIEWYQFETGSPFDRNGPDTSLDRSHYWRGAKGMACITNGALWGYCDKQPELYLCPTFGLSRHCGFTDAVRGYTMNAALNGGYMNNVNLRPASIILFADDFLQGDAKADDNNLRDGMFNTIGSAAKFHSAKRIANASYSGGFANAVYLDGHMDQIR